MKQKKKSLLREELPKYFLLIATILVFLLFGVLQPKFFSVTNFFNILRTSSIIGMMALGVMVSLACGELNFAAGSTAALAGTVVGLLAGEVLPYPLAIVAALAACLLVGMLSSFVAFNIGIPSFIATLGVSKLTDGICKLLSDNKTIRLKTWPDSFTLLGQKNVGVVPIALIAFCVVALLVWVFMEKMRSGKYINSIGTNQVSCRQVGIHVPKMKFLAFAVSSLLCGLSGIVYVSQMNSVSVLAGSDMLMDAIASAILGATFLRPGRFNVQGTALSVVLLTVIQNGVISVGAPSPAKNLVQGVILVIAIGIIALVRKGGLPSVSIGT